ncbi:hypothetical protein AB837_00599 [bacterium AB1]|nr:hypothetical protein AB837_00599 [bacterium AB1]
MVKDSYFLEKQEIKLGFSALKTIANNMQTNQQESHFYEETCSLVLSIESHLHKLTEQLTLSIGDFEIKGGVLTIDKLLLLDMHQFIQIDDFNSLLTGGRNHISKLVNYLFLGTSNQLLEIYLNEKTILDKKCLDSIIFILNKSIFDLKTQESLNIKQLYDTLYDLNEKIITQCKSHLVDISEQCASKLSDVFKEKFLQYKNLKSEILDNVNDFIKKVNFMKSKFSLTDATTSEHSDILQQILEDNTQIVKTINHMIFDIQHFPIYSDEDNILTVDGDIVFYLSDENKYNIYLLFISDKKNIKILSKYQTQKTELQYHNLSTCLNFLQYLNQDVFSDLESMSTKSFALKLSKLRQILDFKKLKYDENVYLLKKILMQFINSELSVI